MSVLSYITAQYDKSLFLS